MEIQKNKNQTVKNAGKAWAIGGSVIAAVCIVIYIFALIQGTLRVYLSIDQRKITAQEEFSRIADIAYSAGLQGFMNDQYVQAMRDALLSSESIEAFIITGSDRGYPFEKQAGSAITIVNNQPRFINKFGLSNQDHFRPLPFADIRNANIKAVAIAFDFIKITDILRETLLIILAGFAIAFFTLLVQLLVKKPVHGEMVYVKTADTSETKKKTKHKESQDAREPSRQKTEERKIINNDSSDDLSDGDMFNIGDSKPAPKGLFSGRSGLGWEEYIKDRLDSELHRCSTAENDLVFILMNFRGIPDDQTFRKAADETVNFFSSRDLIFEYGQSGAAVIIPGADLEAGISKSEKFYQRVKEKISENIDGDLKIGISSRAGRLLNADRLLLETREAIKRAAGDPNTAIIAFKSDPDKYREYIKNRG
ncbi:MAG: hypothetical protein FWC21_02290 [Treponema sp.]|nr:hypothetical protein [Treponema sp.]